MRQDGRFIKDIWIQEAPTGTINGINTVFSLSQMPKESACIMIFLAGLLVPQGIGATEVNISGTTLTFGTAPAISSILRAVYVRRTGE